MADIHAPAALPAGLSEKDQVFWIVGRGLSAFASIEFRAWFMFSYVVLNPELARRLWGGKTWHAKKQLLDDAIAAADFTVFTDQDRRVYADFGPRLQRAAEIRNHFAHGQVVPLFTGEWAFGPPLGPGKARQADHVLSAPTSLLAQLHELEDVERAFSFMNWLLIDRLTPQPDFGPPPQF